MDPTVNLLYQGLIVGTYFSGTERAKTLFIWSKAKSLYRSRAGSYFYGPEYKIWANFWLVGNNEKSGSIMSNF